MSVKLGEYGRSVSIIGVGATPFMRAFDSPETEGYTEGELFAWAAIDAMEDAGIKASDIDYYFHTQSGAATFSDYSTPAVQVGDWAGLRGRGAAHHAEACCSGYVALDMAVNMVASGKYDIVLSGGVEMASSIYAKGKPAHMRNSLGSGGLFSVGSGPARLIDRAYGRYMGIDSLQVTMDLVCEKYCRTYGISYEQMDDILNAFSLNARKNASKTERALLRTDFADLAKEHGFASAMDYLKSDYNPHISRYLRVSGFEATCDAAAALIVCPTEMAKQFKQKPIEVLGIGMSTVHAGRPDNEEMATREAIRQVYEKTGVTPDEIDLLFANDFVIPSQMLVAELSGYIPKGESWKYALDGRTAYDGDRPINTNGGRTNGHAWAASGLQDHFEAVMQMRGLCGERQVKKLPQTTLLRGFGGTQNATATILRTVD
ncbi:MAG: thiolase family protein [Eubacterium sp.]|nr:thiolase family protein [Eubacterium sp.]